MSQTPEENKPEENKPKRQKTDKAEIVGAKSAPKLRSLFTRLFLEAASVAISLAILWFAALGVLMNRPSVDLAFVKPHYEHWFSQAFDGRSTDIDEYSARWIQERRVIEVHAKGIHIRSDEGAEQIIQDVRGEFRIKDNIRQYPEIVRLNITGGALSIVRTKDKRIQVSLGTPTSSQNVGALWQSEVGTSGGNLLGQIEKISVNAADIYMRDDYNDLDLVFKNISGTFSYANETVSLDAVGVLNMGADLDAAFSIELETTPSLDVFDAELVVNNLIPAKIAPARGPTAILSKLDAPIDLTATIIATDQTGLQDLQLNLVAGVGRLKTGTTYKPFTHARIEAHYDADAKNIQVQSVEIESEALNITASGAMQNPEGGITDFISKTIGFDIDIAAARLNPGQRFDGPLSVESSKISGEFDWKKHRVDFDRLALDFGTFQTNISGGLARNDAGQLISVTADGEVNGIMSSKQLLGFWPKEFALGARDWIETALLSGDLSNIKIQAALDLNDIANHQIANDHLNVRYDAQNGDVRYMRKMPLVRGASGYGVLQGNSSQFFIESAVVDGLVINSGKVNIPKLSPHGGDIVIDLHGTGTAAEMLRISNFPPFEFSKKYGINPQKFGGSGEINLHITRPLLVFLDQNRIVYEVSGKFTDVSIPVGVGTYGLNDGRISLQVDKTGISLSGPIKLGEWQSRLDWYKSLEYENTPAKYTLIGAITRDDLDAFGIGLRRHFGGEIGLHISGEGDGLSVRQADIFANFKEAELNIGSLWYKPKGTAAKLSGRVMLAPNGGAHIENLVVQSEGLDVKGSISIAKDFRLVSLDLPTAKIDGFVDAKVTAKPTKEGVLAINLEGVYLNVEQWVSKAFKTQSGAVSAPIEMTATLDKVSLHENYVLTDARAKFSHTGQFINYALLKGATNDGGFLTEITNDSALGYRTVLVDIPDASKAALVFLGLDSIKGGQLRIDGKLPPSGEQGGLTGQVTLKNFTLVRAPAFTQILSLASLRGMANTLGGAGLKFSKLETQFALEDGVLKIRDGRASGPALGLTGEGDIGIAAKTVDFNGVLVPSYTVNSILGDIPLLGDIIVGKKGEGMFALNYSVKGPFSKTQIGVNPLSALTPGFLRRIFDVKRDKIVDPEIADLIKEQEKKDKSKKKDE